MTKVKYVGDWQNPAPEEIEIYGLTFEKGKWADTADLPLKDRAGVEAKFVGNSHFEMKGEKAHKEEVVPLPKSPAVATPDDGAVEDPRGKQDPAGDIEAPKK